MSVMKELFISLTTKKLSELKFLLSNTRVRPRRRGVDVASHHDGRELRLVSLFVSAVNM